MPAHPRMVGKGCPPFPSIQTTSLRRVNLNLDLPPHANLELSKGGRAIHRGLLSMLLSPPSVAHGRRMAGTNDSLQLASSREQTASWLHYSKDLHIPSKFMDAYCMHTCTRAYCYVLLQGEHMMPHDFDSICFPLPPRSRHIQVRDKGGYLLCVCS